MTVPTVRPLTPADQAQWLPLWRAYQAFYRVDLPEAVTTTTWQRFHDPAEPMHALGAFEGEALLGITHYLFHRSCWSLQPQCYLQDLFTVEAARGRGVGRALIDAVAAAARAAGSPRVHWLTQESNVTAQALYDRVARRAGFIQYELPLDVD